MNIRIKESGKIEELNIIDPKTRLDYSIDFIGNTGAFSDSSFSYDVESGEYTCNQNTFNWWDSVCKVHGYFNNVIYLLRTSLNDDLAGRIISEIQEEIRSVDLDFYSMKTAKKMIFKTLKDYGYAVEYFKDGNMKLITMKSISDECWQQAANLLKGLDDFENNIFDGEELNEMDKKARKRFTQINKILKGL